jgi:hypothetical protein
MPFKASFEFAQRQSPGHEDEKYYAMSYVADCGFPRTNFEYDTIEGIEVHDMRNGKFTLTENGMEVVPFHSRLNHEDYDNTAMVEGLYLNEVSSFLKKKTGAEKIYIFEYLVRASFLYCAARTD